MAQAVRVSGRPPGSVSLVAVTKRQPIRVLQPLLELGIRDFGENYPQELWEKCEGFSGSEVRWHLIGHLQRNKLKRTVPLVRWIHGVDSLRLLQALDQLLEAEDPSTAPSVCLQVNTSGEEAKHGWSDALLFEQAEAIASCRHVKVVGLMTMAALDSTAESARPSFIALRELRDRLKERTGLSLDHLSMGMSNDYITAIEEGATLVRVGSALFEGVFD